MLLHSIVGGFWAFDLDSGSQKGRKKNCFYRSADPYHGPTGDEQSVMLMFGEHNRVTGTAKLATYTAREHIHRHAPAGDWKVKEIVLRDVVG
jgi:hypothetical protein